ncbi:hypothetical protein B0684_04095 [Thioalkalivibrio versutus]|nr:hypothetical protein B0684_04095 [Thioalkalivibrio versutus]
MVHRCLKQEFLLKFARDRRLGRYWLYDARQHYGLCVLNAMVTSLRVHLLVRHVGRARWRVTSWIAGWVASPKPAQVIGWIHGLDHQTGRISV